MTQGQHQYTQSGHSLLCKKCAGVEYGIVYSISPWLAGKALTEGQGSAPAKGREEKKRPPKWVNYHYKRSARRDCQGGYSTVGIRHTSSIRINVYVIQNPCNRGVPQNVHLNLALLCLASNDQEPAPEYEFWPCLAVQMMTQWQHQYTQSGHACCASNVLEQSIVKCTQFGHGLLGKH